MRLAIRTPWLPLVATGFLFPASAAAQVQRQTDADHYTRYELLAPGTAKFRILYEVTATTPGATRYFNVIRRGSVATDEAVFDRMTGKPLRWSVVNGRVAAAGGVRGADSTGEYIAVDLARPVPNEGEARLLIDKTYEDARSYIAGGDTLVFARGLGIKKNSVVLPAGYEIVSVNYPSQVREEDDGRLQLSFMNIGPAEVPYVVRARRLTGWKRPEPILRGGGTGSGFTGVRTTFLNPLGDPRRAERARQDREIVYFLQPPESHAFDLYHDYTESRPGVGRYLNVVRAGSQVSNPSAYLLDTGERLTTRTLRGSAITTAGVDIGEPVTPASEVVVIDFPAPAAGESRRLRISETYTDSSRYRLFEGMLVWDRAFGRPANAMVLPAGWTVTNCSVPATISRTDDGRVRLDFMNPRNDEVSVLLTARRR